MGTSSMGRRRANDALSRRRPASTPLSIEPSSDQPPRVLVIDDEPALQDLVRRMLEPAGWEVYAAATGRLGIEMAVGDYQAILLDLYLEGIPSLDVLKAIRQNVPTPVVVLAGRGDGRAVPQAMRLGAVACLSRPFRMTELRETLRRTQIAAPLTKRI